MVDHGSGHLRLAVSYFGGSRSLGNREQFIYRIAKFGSYRPNEFGYCIEDGNYVVGSFCMDVVDGEFTTR